MENNDMADVRRFSFIFQLGSDEKWANGLFSSDFPTGILCSLLITPLPYPSHLP
jgi:hypothetical protein